MFDLQSFNAQLDNERKNLQFECVKLPKQRSRISPEPNELFSMFPLDCHDRQIYAQIAVLFHAVLFIECLDHGPLSICVTARRHILNVQHDRSETYGKPFNELGQLLAVQSFSHRGTNDVHRASKHVP